MLRLFPGPVPQPDFRQVAHFHHRLDLSDGLGAGTEEGADPGIFPGQIAGRHAGNGSGPENRQIGGVHQRQMLAGLRIREQHHSLDDGFSPLGIVGKDTGDFDPHRLRRFHIGGHVKGGSVPFARG